MFVMLHQLPLFVMFAMLVGLSLAITWCIIALVRFAIPRLGFGLDEPLPIRDSIINACGAVFALMVAFSAAGIWNDMLTARNAVQRETDAIENALVLAAGLPDALRGDIQERMRSYAAGVVASDWPAMRQALTLDAPVFEVSEKTLLGTLELLAQQQGAVGGNPVYGQIVGQLLEVRHARLARLAVSNAGVTWAQWWALWIISTLTVTMVAVCNSHVFRTQIVATHAYALVAAAAYFVILAHDRPFVGRLSVSPLAFEALLAR